MRYDLQYEHFEVIYKIQYGGLIIFLFADISPSKAKDE